MYTIQENVRIVISLLKEYNVRYVVLSPGGTNIPVVQAMQDDSFFHCYSVADERSAMYFAIGLHLQTGEIVATSCTSAQATRNYVPGLTEAYYKHVPILAITTSKLERFQYNDYMQAPDQTSLPVDSVKKSFDLPPVTDENTRVLAVSRTREALLELNHRSPGPVQLNIRIVDSQQGLFESVNLPCLRTIQRYMAWDDWSDALSSLHGKKILIVVGEHRPFLPKQKESIESFCHSYNAAVYVNHFSNYHGAYSVSANLAVSGGAMKLLVPDIIITIGGQTGDYPLYSALLGLSNVEHWRVNEEGDVVDTYSKLTKIFEVPDFYFFQRMSAGDMIDHTYFQAWTELNNSMNYDVELPFSNLYAAQQLYKCIPPHSVMNFAILNSIRCWSYFPLDESICSYANISAFGIDGCNSMLIGESMQTSELCFMITGDLAFFYDMNALGIRHITNNVRILLVNNNGGAEFNVMTSQWKENLHVGTYIAANGHNGSAKGWAENCGFLYLYASNKEEFLAQKEAFVSKNNQPILFELFTRAEDEVSAVRKIVDENKKMSGTDAMKQTISKILGPKGVAIVKRMLGKA